MLSLLNRRWTIKNTSDLPLKHKVFANRGITEKEEARFLRPQFFQHCHNPRLLKDLEKAAQRIVQAIQHKEQITIFGDYDVDGITSTAILLKTLHHLKAQVNYLIPHREQDGYGLKNYLIDQLKSNGTQLLITVDSGITANAEVDYANTLGLTTIITDHHEPPTQLPPAYAIVNPKQPGCAYPFKELSGAGVALKLAQLLLEDFFEGTDVQNIFEGLLEMAMLGTIADCVPLVDENRIICQYGLGLIAQTKSVGLQSLLKISGLKEKTTLSAGDIGFVLAPRLNAAGRMRDAYTSLELLLNPSAEETNALAQLLNQFNQERQVLTQKVLEEAEKLLDTKQKILLVYSPAWPLGVLGLVASKLVEKYNRPAIVLTNKDGKTVASSCRSPDYFDLIGTLRQLESLFVHVGGHKKAAAFTLPLKNLNLFTSQLYQLTEQLLDHQDLTPTLEIESLIQPSEITYATLELLKQLEPHGVGNKKPLFLLEQAIVQESKTIGNYQQHLKLKLTKDNTAWEAIGFNLGYLHEQVANLNSLDLAFSLEENEWNGSKKLQLKLADLRISAS